MPKQLRSTSGFVASELERTYEFGAEIVANATFGKVQHDRSNPPLLKAVETIEHRVHRYAPLSIEGAIWLQRNLVGLSR